MNDLLLFLAGSVVVVWLSRKPLRKPGSHGFYRFFAWEAILALIVLNHGVWGDDPYSPHQFTSWLLMLLSMFLVAEGTRTLRRHGAANAQRDDGSFMAASHDQGLELRLEDGLGSAGRMSELAKESPDIGIALAYAS